MIKKNQHISDNIITTADNDDTTGATTLTDTALQNTEQNTTRHRHRPKKIPKTADRTLLIPQTVPSKDTSVNGVKDETQRKSGGGDEGRTEQEGGKEGDTWTQNQQVIFEWALRHFPKGTDKRWDKIAEQIPGKTKVMENEMPFISQWMCTMLFVCLSTLVCFFLLPANAKQFLFFDNFNHPLKLLRT